MNDSRKTKKTESDRIPNSVESNNLTYQIFIRLLSYTSFGEGMGVYGYDTIGKDNACDSCVLMGSMCPDFLNGYAVVGGRNINHSVRAGADAGNHPMGSVPE